MIGIGITTRNRSEVLEWALKHFKTFEPELTYTIVVVDDNSDEHHRTKNESYSIDHKYIYNNDRKGIAASKNVCIKALQTSEHIFLFDDDFFPYQSLWDVPFRNLITHGVEHSMYCVVLPKEHEQIVSEDSDLFFSINKAQGGCLYFTKKCLETVGLYDENFGLYGYEHSDMSLRATKLGFCKQLKYSYVVPVAAKDFIYSLDLDLCFLQKITSLGPIPFEFQTATFEKQEALQISTAHFNKLYID